uniref:Probable membrane transporter protein n=1 Tax=Candidatus Desulfatibia profunda TaxID=2841695 RepID=A0A8J6NQS9_9BACT|nr:sulfite exporter TauE/SafE family protein [Candidatus Desulfatibia profunda]
MKTMRKIYDMLMYGAYAHAKWEYEASMSILRNKKKMVCLLIMFIALILVGAVLVNAKDTLMLGGNKAYAPPVGFAMGALIVAILVGFAAGLMTGAIGVGGGVVITPALMSVGIRGIVVVGTDLLHMFAKAIMGTVVHKKLGNVNYRLAIAFVFGSIFGVTLGGYINRAVYAINPVLSDVFISIIYVVLLGFLGFYAIYDYFQLRKIGTAALEERDKKVELPSVARRLQSLTIPPMIKFDEDLVPDGRRISFILVTIVGFFVGTFAAIMGVGGGFLTFPAFVFVLGISSFTTVGTDVLQIVFTTGYAAIAQYAIYGFIFVSLAMGLLLGSLIGVQLGALTTKVVKGMHIRAFYGLVMLAGFVNRLFALPSKFSDLGTIHISKSLAGGLKLAGVLALYGIVAYFALWVFYHFIANIKTLRWEALGKEG